MYKKTVLLLCVCLWLLAKTLWNVIVRFIVWFTASVGTIIAPVILGFAFGVGLNGAMTMDMPEKGCLEGIPRSTRPTDYCTMSHS